MAHGRSLKTLQVTFLIMQNIQKKLMQIAIDKFTDLRGAVEPGLSMAKGAVNTVFDSAVNKIKGLLKDSGGNVK